MKKNLPDTVLSDRQLEKELHRTVRKRQRWIAFRNTVLILLVISAVCVLAAGLWFPLYRVTGNSMEPSLEQGQVVAAFRTNELDRGDMTVFYHDNQILIKRVIGISGDRISIDAYGKVSVNGEILNEEYITEPVLESSDLTYPYQVPEGCYFVMGDHRAASLDSRMSSIGCISKEMIAGRIIFRIWPVWQVEYLGWRDWD